jgi:phospholipid/cholesterol/gamma-HCH transport system substrate-binding protein
MDPRGQAATPARKIAGLVLVLLCVSVLALVYLQFRGAFTPITQLTLLSGRAGLVMDKNAKVTFNGVEVGRVTGVSEQNVDGAPKARLLLDVDPTYIPLIPANVVATITATTVFGNKYVSLTSPKSPALQHISNSDVIDVSSVSTEFNTLFETITSISEKVDPVRLNATLAATAEALTGLGSKFGASLANGNEILAQLNPELPRLGYDARRLADLAEVYIKASPALWNSLDNAISTAHTLEDQQRDLDAALLASVGFGDTATDVFDRAALYLSRGAADLVPTAGLLDKYSPEFFCTARNYAGVAPRVAASLGGNGYSLSSASGGGAMGAEPPYVYPDNLPRLNATGGPGGAPGCWQSITRDLWPAPYLVMDTGASIAPYNHFELGQPLLNEYVWGRQVGEYTINP